MSFQRDFDAILAYTELQNRTQDSLDRTSLPGEARTALAIALGGQIW